MVSMELPTGFTPGTLGNCGVVALTIITGADYADVWEWFRARYRKSTRWRGVTYHHSYAPCAEAFGARLKKLRVAKGLTVTAWVEWHSIPGRVYLVRVSGHVGVYRDGWWLDNGKAGQPVPVALSRVARQRVTDAWLVLNKNERAK